MKIDFLDLKKISSIYSSEFKNAINNVIDNGWYILGENLKIFENNYANFSTTKYALGVANGLDALILSLIAFSFVNSDACPYKLTAKIALVLLLIAASTSSQLILYVSILGSTGLIVAPACVIANQLAM